MYIEAVSDLRKSLDAKRQRLVEHYETLNQLKQDWDSMNAQHHTLSQRYLPSNIEASPYCHFLSLLTKNCRYNKF